MRKKQTSRSIPTLRKKWLNSDLLLKVRKYLPSLEQYVHYYCIPKDEPVYLKELESLDRLINRKFQLLRKDKVLIHLLSEIKFQEKEKIAEENEAKIAPALLKGSRALLEALKLADYNAENIESFVIKVKPTSNNKLKPFQFKITGTKILQKIISLIRNNLAGFEERSRQERYFDQKSKDKTSTQGAVKKIYTENLYDYMCEKLPALSSRKIKLLGGQVLFELKLINPPRPSKDGTTTLTDAFFISNFEKYL